MAIKKEKQKKEKTGNNLSGKRVQYFIQMLDINRDTKMTRIYSAITSSNFLNPNNNQKQL